ncbi:MAG: dethiobiotin synthase [Thermoflexibacter sp.]|jgi:dethiobiotin synthetase|nr:dethiobiotin synthase [Thermoflexibacter sp.]
MKLFITAIGTDSGKSVVSAILTEALAADYWKPVQSGLPRDRDLVKSLISNEQTIFHQEAYCLSEPLSPHAAAQIDGVRISLANISLPQYENEHIVIEGAGGILVPLNEHDFVIDLADSLEAEVILVANLYLGSINHTLLSIRELFHRLAYQKFTVKGIVFNQSPVPASENIILQHCPFPHLFSIDKEEKIDKEMVLKYAAKIKHSVLKI